ncbi:ATP-binding protein [Streptomyces zagrosensis]|uniref:Anti-sigma regulatory factor (Ser/Thr protein kinase) n=1 Tax=Streptomyces zagrosensis TaxID=1042984 RepID=A0A7W9QFS2_9ACTN|nr:ATP-binding protein [Streptomyces zagrosensis]MBB5939461.1 anti-sigma regulatory factor (Ser/Thr protein kinase) [Streptomyces zagrosensis]
MNQHHPLFSDLTLAATPNAVSWARRHTVDVLRTWRFPDEGIEVARLLASELTTNAVCHAHPERTASDDESSPTFRTILLRLWSTNESVVLVVGDSDPRPPTRRSADEDSTGGRGLILTAAMARRWGYYHLRPYPGKFVWAEVPAGPSPALRDSGTDSAEIPQLVMGRTLMGLREL